MASESRDVERWPGHTVEPDPVVVEEPLEIRVEGRSVAVTMRTPGDDLELAVGFLLTEGVVDDIDDIAAVDHLPGVGNTVEVRLAAGVEAHAEALSKATRELYATSSCGVCGKASIDRLTVLAPPLPDRAVVAPELLASLPDVLAAAQPTFARTGGLHAAALFGLDGTLEVVREDVGRHNAVDKVLGWRLRAGRMPVDDRILLVSSRAGFEIVQKALVARVPVVAAIGAATTLAVDLARRGNLTLVGFLRDGRFNRYA